jgi:hypothetical protein
MISNNYDIKEFLEAMLGKDFNEIFILAEQEAFDAEIRSFNVKNAPKTREKGSVTYSRKVGNFLFFLRQGIRPSGASDEEFSLYRPICEDLVEKQEFQPTVLDLFQNIENQEKPRD